MVFFETIKAVEGEILHCSYHQKRYESVLKRYGVQESYQLRRFLHPPKKGIYRCRLTYDLSAKPHHIHVIYDRYEKREISSLKLVYDDTIDYGLKALNRDRLDELYAKREECDDVLIVKNSLLTDTSIANIALYDSVKWVTPALPLLKGTTRERLLQEGRITEDEIKVSDLKFFSKAALMNAMIDFDIIRKKGMEFIC